MAKNNKKNQDPMRNFQSMGREGLKIMRNIAFGRYNIYEEGHIFRNMEFVNATIAEVDKKVLELTITLTALNAYYYGTTDKNILDVISKTSNAYAAYTLMKRMLMNIVATKDTGFLYTLASKLPAYKYNI